MRIIGIDPGYAIVGFGILDYMGNKFSVVEFGAITTQAGEPFDKRLKTIHDDLSYVLDKYKPESMAIEKLFLIQTRKTVIDVAQARGVISLCATQRNIEISEYTPCRLNKQ